MASTSFPRAGVARASIGALEVSVVEVIIQGIIPCMPYGCLILVSLSSSSVPRIPIHSYMKKITGIQIEESQKVLESKCDVLNENA